MLLAVLDRRVGVKLGEHDVYVSTVGGIRITEPGADLAIALALCSAARDEVLPRALVAVGEISLAGEIRAVSNASQRASEARRLGFDTVIDAEAGLLKVAVARAFPDAAEPMPRF
jgi:DNA repair protein RadA/Sms